MENELFLHAGDVAEKLGISKSFAYKLVKEMNEELKAKGYITIPGRVSKCYFEERFYGLGSPNKEGKSNAGVQR